MKLGLKHMPQSLPYLPSSPPYSFLSLPCPLSPPFPLSLNPSPSTPPPAPISQSLISFLIFRMANRSLFLRMNSTQTCTWHLKKKKFSQETNLLLCCFQSVWPCRCENSSRPLSLLTYNSTFNHNRTFSGLYYALKNVEWQLHTKDLDFFLHSFLSIFLWIKQ